MKIGIMTFYSSDNFGGVLQCLGIQKEIENMFPGDSVKIINFAIPAMQGSNMSKVEGIEKRKELFALFRKTFLHLSGEVETDPDKVKLSDYDVCIVGSDQVWNPAIIKGYEEMFFLYAKGFKADVRRLSYAASIGNYNLSADEAAWLKRNLLHMDAISVREESGESIVQGLVDRKVCALPDPTMLHEKEYWESIEKKPEGIGEGKYVFMYALGYRWCREAEEEASRMAAQIADKNGLKIIHNYYGAWKSRFPENAEHCYFQGPREFLWLIHHAEYVICCSFHGTAFSILYEKPFYTFAVPGNGERMKSLVDSLGMPERYLDKIIPMEKMNWDIDWERVKRKLLQKRKEAENYLRKAIVE